MRCGISSERFVSISIKFNRDGSPFVEVDKTRFEHWTKSSRENQVLRDSKNLIDGGNNGIYIGYANLTANNDYDGYIDEFRITQKARYTSNFTAPTKAFPNL